MPQKKGAKRANMKKSTAKSQTQQGILVLAEKIEKEFRQIPSKLSKLYRQELKIQKKTEAKLKSDIKKAEVMQKTALKKQSGSAKAKQAANTIKALTKKLDQVKKTAEKLHGKQKKYTALKKGLAQLEKELNTTVKAKKTAPRKIKSAKSIKQTDSHATKKEIMTEETPFMISSQTETVES